MKNQYSKQLAVDERHNPYMIKHMIKMNQKDPKFRLSIKTANKEIRYFINQVMTDISKQTNSPLQ